MFETLAIDNKKIQRRLLELQFEALPFSIIAAAINAAILAVLLWGVVNNTYIGVWLLTLFGLSLARLYLCVVFAKKKLQNRDFSYWIFNHHVLTIASGLIWGCLPIFLFPYESIPHQAFVAFIIAGTSAASITVHSYIIKSGLLFIVLLLLPLAFRYFSMGETLGHAMSAITVVYMVAVCIYACRNAKIIVHNVELQEDLQEKEILLSEQIKSVDQFIKNSPVGILIYEEKNGCLVLASINPAAEGLLEDKDIYKVGESLSESFLDMQNDDLISLFIDCARYGNSRRWSQVSYTSNNKKRFYDVLIFQLRAGQVAVLFSDITDQIDREKELQQAKLRAEDSSRSKSQFIASISHELRTPLNSIIGFAGVVKIDNGDESRKREAVDAILRNGHQLLDLINDLIDVSKLDSGQLKLAFRVRNIQSIVDEAANKLEYLFENKGIPLKRLYDNELPKIRMDAVRVEQIVINLLSNAIKYTHAGEVSISLRKKHYEQRDGVELTVSDTGIGIESNELPRLFQHFYKLMDRREDLVHGVGLGLLLVKEFSQMHGGTVTVDSAIGKGSNFRVWLPVLE